MLHLFNAPLLMCAEVSSSDGLKKAVRKHEKKLRQITHLEEQSSFRELTKEEIEKVESKGNVQKELNELKLMVEPVEVCSSEQASGQVDKGDEDMNDSITSMTDNTVSKKTSTPTKRPHIVEVSSCETHNDFVGSSDLSEPDTKRMKNINDNELEAERTRHVLWCDKDFVISKLDGHNDVICSLDCNQHILLTGSRDTSLKVWSLHTFEMLHHMGGHTSVVTCVRLPPGSADFYEKTADDKSTIGLSGSLDCSVKIWNLDTGQLMCSVYVFSPVTCMDYWCDGRVAIGTEGGKVDVWDLRKGENVCTVRHSTTKSKPVTCLKVFENYIYCADSSVQMWQLGPNNHTTLLLDTDHMMSQRKPSNSIRCMCIHCNSIFWGDNGVNFKVCNCHTGEVKKHPAHSGKRVVTGAMTISNDVILCAGYDQDQGTSYINVHSLYDGKHITTLTDNSSEYITCMACLEGVCDGESEAVMPSSDSSVIRLITGGNNAELKVWDMISSNVSLSEENLSLSLKSYQHTLKTLPYSSPREQCCDTDSSRGSDDNCSTHGDTEADVDLHNQPLPVPRPQPIITQESSWWCSIL